MKNKTLPEEIKAEIKALRKEGSNLQMGHKYIKAVSKFIEAISILPEPKEQWKEFSLLLKETAENYWLNARFNKGVGGGFAEALDCYRTIMSINASIGRDSYHARIGELQLELGNTEKAKEELIRTYLISGRKRFNYMDDQKYFEFIKPIIENETELVKYSTDIETYSFD